MIRIQGGKTADTSEVPSLWRRDKTKKKGGGGGGGGRGRGTGGGGGGGRYGIRIMVREINPTKILLRYGMVSGRVGTVTYTVSRRD